MQEALALMFLQQANKAVYEIIVSLTSHSLMSPALEDQHVIDLTEASANRLTR
jgi:hypothetical protein